MAEEVNKRLEEMIDELEQMKRMGLYTAEEIREIARKRKEFEYKIQRKTKCKEDYTDYICYEYTLLENLGLRRKQTQTGEKRHSIEYVIAKRLNKLFKQYIMRFQNDLNVYFQYIMFCQSVGFKQAVSAIIGQMLQVHGDKAQIWQMAAKWEHHEHKNMENAKTLLLKGIHRHPDSADLYLDLFNIELLLGLFAKDDENKEKQLKRADIVWRNGVKDINDVDFLFKLCDLSLKYEAAHTVSEDIKREIWARNDSKDVWAYIAKMEILDHHWNEIEEFVKDDPYVPEKLNIFVSVYEEALDRFPAEELCTKYIHTLLGLTDYVCTDKQKIDAVKLAWMFGHEHGLLSDYMYTFGIEMYQIEGAMDKDELMKILNEASKLKPKLLSIWKGKILLSKDDDKKMLTIVEEASKLLKTNEVIELWNVLLDNVTSGAVVKEIYKKFQKCEHSVFLALKPKLLEKTYEHRGLKAARDLYDELVKTPPLQQELHLTMLEIEESQPIRSYKNLKKCHELMVRFHGTTDYEIWLKYIDFESRNGNSMLVGNIYRSAIKALNKSLVAKFIEKYTLDKLK